MVYKKGSPWGINLGLDVEELLDMSGERPMCSITRFKDSQC